METGENNPILIELGNFNINSANSYHLSIQLGLQHFSYCLLNTSNFTYDYIRIYTFKTKDDCSSKISEIINNDDIVTAGFSSQSLAFVGNLSTLVPDLLYKEEENEQILSFNTKISGKVLADSINEQQAHLIYSVSDNILNIVNNFFPKAKQKSQESMLIKQYSKSKKNTQKAFIYFNNKHIIVTVFNNNKLIFNNSFNFNTKEDLLYYVLYSFEQLNISTEDIDTEILGDIQKNDEYFNLLYDYIRNLSLAKRPSQLNFPKEFEGLPEHKYFGLFTQVLCV